jgi:hypothetical protein
MTSDRLLCTCIGTLAILSGACSSGGNSMESGSGGAVGSGGATGLGGQNGTIGQTGSGGTATTGGAVATGGQTGKGGSTGTGGFMGSGGGSASGGITETGGQIGTGGTSATGGRVGRDGGRDLPTGSGGATGGQAGSGGMGDGGKTGAGGAATGGSTAGSTGTVAIDCNAAMPSGGTPHSGNSQGGTGNLVWSLWQNGNGGSITTFGTTAFSASWGPSSGDFLARIGLEWGSSGKTYDQYGTITAQFAYKKTGTGGGYSYIGIYGWSNNPCVEYYIVDDSFNTMPFNAYGATLKGTTTIDGESYKLFSNNTTGSGGSRCSGVSSWLQFWSIRQKGRQCGQISITQHFDAWKAAGMTLGNMLEAKILVEVGGGTGSIDFPVANVTTIK